MTKVAIKPTRELLREACGSNLWVALVSRRAPFATSSDLHVVADEAFDELSEDDWLEAFAHHPAIGDVTELRARFGSGASSEIEQAGLAGTAQATLEELARGNAAYEATFGFVFLVRAAGRSAEDILALQRERLTNDRGTELGIAAQQQREITHLRLERALAELDPVRPQGER